MELITIHENIPVVDHTVIAQQTDNQAINIARLLQNHKDDFEVFGGLCVLNTETPKQGGRPQKIYKLNEQQATLLMTYLKNTPIVRKFKVALVKAFYNLREKTGSYQVAKVDNTHSELMAIIIKNGIEARREVDNMRGHVVEMHNHMIQYIKPKDNKHAKAGYKGAETKLKKKIEHLENQLKELKIEEKRTRADFRIERDRTNKLQTKLDRYKK